jgi:hypothetical protein
MYSNPKKAYYNALSNSGSGSVVGSAFIKEAIILLNYYNSNNIILWNTEYNSIYAQLKASNQNYQNDTTAYTISQLIDNLNTSIIVTADLRNQVIVLEQTLAIEHNDSSNMVLGSGSIEQNAQLNKVYVQYMLIFNLSSTNGIFIPSNLNKAQNLLDTNAGQITIPIN